MNNLDTGKRGSTFRFGQDEARTHVILSRSTVLLFAADRQSDMQSLR
jgi:hypothetical protein